LRVPRLLTIYTATAPDGIAPDPSGIRPVRRDDVSVLVNATLVGTFKQDLAALAAVETLVWGEPGRETTVVRTWRLEQ